MRLAGEPIKATAHGIVDYGFLALGLLGPAVLGLSPKARFVFGGQALTQGAINALTDTPVGLKRLIPLRAHGTLEAASGPLFAALPWRTGVLAEPRARAFFAAQLALLATVYGMTDWTAPADS